MVTGYFHRVHQETPTRFWINNPSGSELDQALAAGAINCTTNPTYGAKLLQSEPDLMQGLIAGALQETEDDEVAADLAVQAATARLLARFLPLYERSGGAQGFVTLQSDPRKEEDASEILEAARRYRALGPNFMTKIPVTPAGLEAMEALIAEDFPLCATEVFSIDQAIAICELYQRVTQRTGKRPPCYVTHITGIFDEYLSKLAEREDIAIASETLSWAGATVARKEYRLLKERSYPVTLLGGGARTIRHFTDFVGGDFHITINGSTAQELIERDEPAVSRIDIETPPQILNELLEKLPDFRRAYHEGGLPVEEFADYGPVQLFRNNFIAGYERLLEEVAAQRAQSRSEGKAAPVTV